MDICKMVLLLAAATPKEIQPAIDAIAANNDDPHHIEVLITGVGSAAASYKLTKAINQCQPSLVIQAGIAGSFQPGLQSQVYAVEKDLFADLGVWENDQFRSVFDLGFGDPNKFPFEDGYLKNPHLRLLTLTGLKAAAAITVNEITTTKQSINRFAKIPGPLLESMEGAALHYVCRCEKVPFIQLRAVSNQVGERNKAHWDITGAVYQLNKELLTLLNSLSLYDETYFRI
jgi:futalosine hydrolase